MGRGLNIALLCTFDVRLQMPYNLLNKLCGSMGDPERQHRISGSQQELSRHLVPIFPVTEVVPEFVKAPPEVKRAKPEAVPKSGAVCPGVSCGL